MMDKDFYANPDEGTTGAYLDYLTRLLVLGGESEEAARADAQRVYDMEKVLTAASLDVQDRGNVDLIYNVFDLEELKEVFPRGGSGGGLCRHGAEEGGGHRGQWMWGP